MLVRRDMPLLHLRRSSTADYVGDQSPVGAFEGLVAFEDQLCHTRANGVLSECGRR